MKLCSEILNDVRTGGYDGALSFLYRSDAGRQQERYAGLLELFMSEYGDVPAILVSAPGRTEIGGNHTDHQRGRVLAASVNLDTICVAAPKVEGVVRVKSVGHPKDEVNVGVLDPPESEKETSAALIRGVAAGFSRLGYRAGGFDAYTTSDVLKGSGLSSSAAFEVAIGTIMNRLYNAGKIDAVTIAQIGQYAENVHFGKPSGLMDQAASSVGGFVAFDFKNPQNPVVEPVSYDFSASGHSLCIVDTKGSHSELTFDYAAAATEMRDVARFFGREFLREVDEKAFFKNMGKLREKLEERPVLRAMHFFGDDARVPKQAAALKAGDFETFKRLVIDSGRSSRDMLQNVFSPARPKSQGLSLALSLSERLLDGKGAWRVHGGGFAGTIQAFVPNELLEAYCAEMDAVFGEGSCHVLFIRPVGGIEVTPLFKEAFENGRAEI